MSSFMDQLKDKARQHRKTVVLPEGSDIRTIQAASAAMREGLADIVMLGDPARIREMAGGIDISRCRIEDPERSERSETYVEQFLDLRKAKGINRAKAIETMKNPLYFGCMMVRDGVADGMVAGAVNSTGDVMRAALQVIRTAPGIGMVSTFFIICVSDSEYGENGTFVFADAALNENPDAGQLADIAIASAASFQSLIGREPYVAMLSYSTHGSARSPLTEKMVEATRIAKARAPHLNIDGELQVDAAIVASVARSKAPGSPVAGKANVLVFPDLDSGNISYKLVQRLAKAEAYAVTQGLAKPVNDLSRGCSAEDIVGTIAITAIQAQSAPAGY